jgi:site-specific recombinase XerD
MRTDYLKRQELQHLLAALMPVNRLALEISLATGLRISDVLEMRTEALKAATGRRLSIRELKTGKRRRVTLSRELFERALAIAGKVYVFEHRLDYKRPRTRQAVYKDLKAVARVFKIDGKRIRGNIAPHTARKAYAVEAYKKSGDLRRVQQLLNHSSEAVTMIYAMADRLTDRRGGENHDGA